MLRGTAQKDMIVQHLESGNAITSLEALNLFGCFRLASRITDLKKEGYDINDRFVENNGKKFKQYWLRTYDRRHAQCSLNFE